MQRSLHITHSDRIHIPAYRFSKGIGRSYDDHSKNDRHRPYALRVILSASAFDIRYTHTHTRARGLAT